MKKKLLSVLLASSMVLSLAACGASSETAPQSTDTQQPQSTETTASDANASTDAAPAADAGTNKGVINVCLASEPATLDPALNSAVDGATMIN
ncbi:MAG: hypothetical protein IJJ65_09550, partial [Butyrivibrio sp.]|nr:hypothetical protein [Butyrivibrio sp.]